MNVAEKFTKTFVIPSFRDAEFQGIIKQLNRRCEKLGLEPITVTHAKSLRLNVRTNSEHGEDNAKVVYSPVLITQDGKLVNTLPKNINHMVYVGKEYCVEGVLPVLSGWQFMGVKSLEHSHAVFRMSPFLENEHSELPGRLQDDCSNCEHCKTKRNRKDVKLLRNVDSGEWMQVGSTCIDDFIGGEAALHKLKLQEAIFELVSDYTSWLEEDAGFSSSPNAMDLRAFLAAVSFCAEMDNEYVSKAQASSRGSGVMTTVDQAMQLLQGNARASRAVKALKSAFFSEYQKYADLADKAVEHQKTLFMDGNLSQFENTIKVIVDDGWFNPQKEAGFAGWIVGGYLRHLIAERELLALNNSYLPDVEEGDRIENKRLFTLFTKRTVDFRFGESTLHVFRDDEGRRYKGYSSKTFNKPDGFNASFIIKGFTEYKDVLQTEISRIVDLDHKFRMLFEEAYRLTQGADKASVPIDHACRVLLGELDVNGPVEVYTDAKVSQFDLVYYKHDDADQVDFVVSFSSDQSKNKFNAWAKAAQGSTLLQFVKSAMQAEKHEDALDPLDASLAENSSLSM